MEDTKASRASKAGPRLVAIAIIKSCHHQSRQQHQRQHQAPQSCLRHHLCTIFIRFGLDFLFSFFFVAADVAAKDKLFLLLGRSEQGSDLADDRLGVVEMWVVTARHDDLADDLLGHRLLAHWVELLEERLVVGEEEALVAQHHHDGAGDPFEALGHLLLVHAQQRRAAQASVLAEHHPVLDLCSVS